jgi:hypothetical protein
MKPIIYFTRLGDKVTTYISGNDEHVIVETRPAAERLAFEPETTSEIIIPPHGRDIIDP